MPAHLVVNETLPSNLTALYQANRFVARSADGTWFYSFQDGVNGRVVWHNAQGWVNIPLDPQPTMRPTLYVDPSGLYVSAGFDGDKQHLLVWYIDEYQSVYPATGAPGPKGPPGPAGSATLDPRYVEVLERLCRLLGI